MFDWLATPAGIGLVQALTVLLVAAAGYLAYLSKRSADSAREHIDRHVSDHVPAPLPGEGPKG